MKRPIIEHYNPRKETKGLFNSGGYMYDMSKYADYLENELLLSKTTKANKLIKPFFTYSEYLFSELLKTKNKQCEGMEYDKYFSIIPGLYKHFENSNYNTDTLLEYECILAYLDSVGWLNTVDL